METESMVSALPRVMLHPDDASRVARPLRVEVPDRPRASSENNRFNLDQPDLAAILDDSPPRANDKTTNPNLRRDGVLLSPEETTELFKTKVADAKQDTEHALEGNEEMSDEVRPKLTLDLGHSNIARLPEGVVDLIKTEVERLSLSHNQIWYIPPRFSECSHLRYLNIRSNVFREIPRGVYKLPLLEILDISRNKIRQISPEIRNLTSLRVFSILHNRVDDLPSEICEMTNLQILKVGENPLRFKLKKVVELKETELFGSNMTDFEKEAAITLEIKRFLREIHPVATPVEVETPSESGDSPADTPKPFKRVVSSRFPVIPSSGITTADLGDGNKSSPLQGNPPPVPSRSHFRMTSGQGINLRRPGITPLISNERNRSNSESVLQASAAARSKRMGMLRKERTELDRIDESRLNRNSHLRGVSHASALKRNSNLISPNRGPDESPTSPKDSNDTTGFVLRLTSLPELRNEDKWHNAVIEGAKGILYALYQIHPQIAGLIAAIKGSEVRRNSLEFTFYNASTHVDRLNEALVYADSVGTDDEEAIEKAEDTVRRDCATCIMAYSHVTAQLQDNVRKVVAGADPRYIRTLLLLLYGSMIEIRNAISTFGADVRSQSSVGHRRHLSSGNTHPIQTIPEEFTTPQPGRSATPTRGRNLTLRPGSRLRSDTTIQHTAIEQAHGFHAPPVQQPVSAIHLTGTIMNGGTASTVSSYDMRSRSSSRNPSNTSVSNSSISSVASTPRSGEGFNLPPPNNYTLRVNPTTGLTDVEEESRFEEIFLTLTKAYDASLSAIPIAKAQFQRYLDAAGEGRQAKTVIDLWSTLIYRCKICLDVTEGLQIRLANMRIKDTSMHSLAAGNGRNDPSFWLLCKTFLQSFIDLVTEMREAKGMRLLPPEIIQILRPVQKTSREAGRLIENSPWKALTDGVNVPSQFHTNTHQSVAMMNANGYGNGVHPVTNGINGTYPAAQYGHQSQSPFPPPLIPVPVVPGHSSSVHSNAGSINHNGPSPVSVPLPATPLSAALGPAAQATIQNVPSTPASAYGDSFFRGDVFQRADSLLNMQQAGAVNFLNRR